jgi:2-polyprenyl-3-methyl-5-hydroxy-6-metoxy-1,4-benzoquinol methylase
MSESRNGNISRRDAGHLECRLAEFIERVVTHDLASHAAACCSMPYEEAQFLLRIYANEAFAGLRLIAPLLTSGTRVLEVGSGIGVLSAFLAEAGSEIVGIEPGAIGFGFMSEMAAAIRARVDLPSAFKPLPIGAGDLTTAKHGLFDLIYSVNVVEHINDLDEAFRAMAGVLGEAGVMVHHCPNYALPYEPHFGIPLVPVFPRATRYVFPHLMTKYPGLWDSFNFVTAGRIRRIARRISLDVTFDRHVMGDAVRRLQQDPIYRDRQRTTLVRGVSAFSAMGGLRLIDAIPPGLASPMIMRLRHARCAGAGRH